MFSVLQRSPQETALHQTLSRRMLVLCGTPTESLRPYTHHLQVLGINWFSYQPDPKYKDKLADLKSTDDESKFDEVILKLVNVLDEEWFPMRSEETKTKLAAIIPRVDWKFDQKVGKAHAVFSEKQKACDAVDILQNRGIQARVMYGKDMNRTPYVVIDSAFSQVKKMEAPSEGLKPPLQL